MLISPCTRLRDVWHEKSRQLFVDTGKRTGIDRNIPDKDWPKARQSVRHVSWNCCLAACKSRSDGAREPVIIEAMRPCQNSDVVAILHATVGAPQRYHRLKFLRDYRFRMDRRANEAPAIPAEQADRYRLRSARLHPQTQCRSEL